MKTGKSSFGKPLLSKKRFVLVGIVDSVERKSYYSPEMSKEEEVKNPADGLTEAQKPTVFIEGKYKGPGEIGTKGPGSASDDLCVMAGGINIAGDLATTYPKVTWEWVITKNPDVIIKDKHRIPSGYDTALSTTWKLNENKIKRNAKKKNRKVCWGGRFYASFIFI